MADKTERPAPLGAEGTIRRAVKSAVKETVADAKKTALDAKDALESKVGEVVAVASDEMVSVKKEVADVHRAVVKGAAEVEKCVRDCTDFAVVKVANWDLAAVANKAAAKLKKRVEVRVYENLARKGVAALWRSKGDG